MRARSMPSRSVKFLAQEEPERALRKSNLTLKVSPFALTIGRQERKACENVRRANWRQSVRHRLTSSFYLKVTRFSRLLTRDPVQCVSRR